MTPLPLYALAICLHFWCQPYVIVQHDLAFEPCERIAVWLNRQPEFVGTTFRCDQERRERPHD